MKEIREIKKSCKINQVVNGEQTIIQCYGKCITKYPRDENTQHINTWGWFLVDGEVKEITNPAFEVEV